MSDSVRPHRWQPTRLPRPWDFPGKNTGVGCHFLLQCVKVKSESEVAQSCPTLCNPIDCSLPGSSVHEIFQARVLEWATFPSPGDLPNPGIEPRSPTLQTGALPSESPGKPQEYWSGLQFPSLGDLPDPGIKPTCVTSPALGSRFLTASATWEAQEESHPKSKSL